MMAQLRLPNSVSSPQDVEEILLEVREYAKWFSHNAIKKRAGVRKISEPPIISPAAMETIRSWVPKKSMTSREFDRLCNELEEYEAKAPVVTITLAAQATKDVKHSLIDWCRDNIAPNTLISFRFNSTLLGGMVLQFGSHIHDWSFRRQIMDARSKFPETLRRV
jgi:hypothetical protein